MHHCVWVWRRPTHNNWVTHWLKTGRHHCADAMPSRCAAVMQLRIMISLPFLPRTASDTRHAIGIHPISYSRAHSPAHTHTHICIRVIGVRKWKQRGTHATDRYTGNARDLGTLIRIADLFGELVYVHTYAWWVVDETIDHTHAVTRERKRDHEPNKIAGE